MARISLFAFCGTNLSVGILWHESYGWYCVAFFISFSGVLAGTLLSFTDPVVVAQCFMLIAIFADRQCEAELHRRPSLWLFFFSYSKGSRWADAQLVVGSEVLRDPAEDCGG